MAEMTAQRPIAQASDRDLLIALVNGACLSAVVPMALEIVERDPLASAGCFRGDLLRGLMEVPGGFWGRYPRLYERYRRALRLGASMRRRQLPAERMEFWSVLDHTTLGTSAAQVARAAPERVAQRESRAEVGTVLINMKASGRDPLSYVLTSGGREIGWLRAGLIGFGGFADRAQARRAATCASEVLAEWYVIRWRSAPIAWPETVAPDDRVEVDDVVVGRLLSTPDIAIGGGASHGFELVVPRETWIALMLQLSQRLYVSLVDAGIVTDAGSHASGVTA